MTGRAIKPILTVIIIGSGKQLDWLFDSNIYETWTDHREMSKQDAHSRFDMLALPE